MLRVLLENYIKESKDAEYQHNTNNMVLDLVEQLEAIVNDDNKCWVAVMLGSKTNPKVMLLSPITIATWVQNKNIMDGGDVKTGITTPNKTFNHPSGLEFNDRDKLTYIIPFSNPRDGAKKIEKYFGKGSNTVTFTAVFDKSKTLAPGRGKQYRSKDMWIDDKNGCQINAADIELTITNLMTGFYHYDGI